MDFMNDFNPNSIAELSEPFLNYFYSKNKKNNFIGIMTVERVCVLWNKIIRQFPDYEKNKNKIKEISIITHFCEPGRKGIFGIGQKLTQADIGQKFLRCAPIHLSGETYDWSYVPHIFNSKDIKNEVRKLIEITNIEFIFENKKFNKNFYDDGNWISESDCEEFIANYSLKIFPSRTQLNPNVLEFF